MSLNFGLQIKECRNQVMHASSLEIEEADMREWQETMISLLEDKTRLGGLAACQEAANKIRAVSLSRKHNV